MSKNLVIVESPAKAKTIEKFLGKEYKVMSSYGHIRDLKKRNFSIDTETFRPQYEVPTDKAHLVTQLKQSARKAEMVWLASDEDREGEAISWHLQEVLKLKPETTRRIVFHEITQPAILAAIKNPRQVDMALVNAQQARRVLDRIVGFKLSPVLWRKVKPSLSAGRVQSVAVRLIVEREREVQAFVSEASYRITALFNTPDGSQMKAELNRRFATREEAEAFLKEVATASFKIEDIQTKPIRRSPAPPFTTSTMQQEAAHKLGLPVAQTMLIAQHLYESGLITYMRTDSVNLSQLALGACSRAIKEMMGEQYVKTRQFHTSIKGAQEAHEAIRPTYMDRTDLQGYSTQERRLYDLIWKRTVASQMADAEMEKTTVSIGISGREEQFIAAGEVIKFDGFLKVYRETTDNGDLTESSDVAETSTLLPPLTMGDTIERVEIVATERFTQRPARFNEASLVRKLEELGIGRPSTYAPTISTIQQREYVTKGDKAGEERSFITMTLTDEGLRSETSTAIFGAERNRLLPTDTGVVVNDFLMEYFPMIMDYNFTADVEKEFDAIADGKEEWTGMIRNFWTTFEPLVEETLNSKNELRAGERVLGVDPESGKPVSVKIGRFGPVAQIGSAEDLEKPRFAQLRKGQSIETITLDEVLELFRLPRHLGTYEGDEVVIGTGRYGNYVSFQKKFISLDPDADPLTIELDDAIKVIEERRKAEADRFIKRFDEEPDLEIIRGRFGPYLTYKEQNYRLPKAMQERAADLTLAECLGLIKDLEEKAKNAAPGSRRYARKNKQG
ncbi:MAG: type I DNA topoisomerase [Bacteroidaceae bacterium]|nr:type I DNA topoisomerase [Bacteroidaceae bacterium]